MVFLCFIYNFAKSSRPKNKLSDPEIFFCSIMRPIFLRFFLFFWHVLKILRLANHTLVIHASRKYVKFSHKRGDDQFGGAKMCVITKKL